VTPRDDRGSTLPLILGFFLVALIVIAGSVAAGEAFVQQRGLQDVCDGAAAAAAATGVDLGRGGDLETEPALQFGDVRGAVAAYLARDPSRHGVHVNARLSDGARTLTLTCEQTERIAFGAMFGQAGGVRHRVTSSARAPLS
jgi:uncharacterized membrane protein